MTNDKLRRQNRVVIIILVILVCCGLGIHQYFNYALKPVDPSSKRIIHVEIPKGATDHQVGVILKGKRLVRSSFVCDYYLQTHKEAGVKAGTFKLKGSYSTPQIVKILQESRESR
ncbi:endolytic transglycosylase MltG [Limosilactobacillus agrestimuris]|uniref:endolytic transglycosylase MltG n=1 Tax=Limosilactobacillus agrestimuris TaxID=2941331 RepID=UPI00203A974F|nr:endolytic transglycosylase MltG [Limosilactobacillus agrestimuris]